ncbi:hypothetical protein, partial [Alkalibacterium sp.]|uniref:hypothetical protein n=1 Tax=Alkalibacterium sp. TaxID=1872447 RepID=UPI003970A43D
MIGSRYRKLDTAYLVLSSLGLLMVMLSNTAASLLPTHETSRSVVSIGILLLLLIVGAALTRAPLVRAATQQASTPPAAERPAK